MKRSIKAIDTWYRGNCHRSREEGRWAVFFYTMGIPYKFEPQGYARSDGATYLPDYWFPRWQCYGEVKPETLTLEEFDVASSLPHCCLLFEDEPKYHFYYAAASCLKRPTWDLDEAYGLYLKRDPDRLVDLAASARRGCLSRAGDHHLPEDNERLRVALVAARSARFEHGCHGELEDFRERPNEPIT